MTQYFQINQSVGYNAYPSPFNQGQGNPKPNPFQAVNPAMPANPYETRTSYGAAVYGQPQPVFQGQAPQAVAPTYYPPQGNPTTAPKPSWVESAKQWLINALFEAKESDRPIGISQLSKRTFVSTGGGLEDGVFFKNNLPQQNFKYSKLK